VIVTLTPFVQSTTNLVPKFFDRSTCNNCLKDIFRGAYRDTNESWSKDWRHEELESEYCHSQYLNLRNDYDVNTAKAHPVYGPVNLELYWM
jgi:hypothetical protein